MRIRPKSILVALGCLTVVFVLPSLLLSFALGPLHLDTTRERFRGGGGGGRHIGPLGPRSFPHPVAAPDAEAESRQQGEGIQQAEGKQQREGKQQKTKGMPGKKGGVKGAPSLRIAVAVTILRIDPDNKGWLDGAAVFARAVRDATATSKYPHDIIALVLPDAVEVSRRLLEPHGFIVMNSPIPVQPEEITSDDFRAEIVKSGCCGHSELIKFCAYKLIEYDFVMHLDIDTLLFGPVLLQHLCNAFLNTFATFCNTILTPL
jgi:hypothetical protein